MNTENMNPRKIKGTKREAVLTIEKFAGDGVSLAHDEEGKVIFVRYALPGEKIRVNIYKEAKDYAMAEPLEILESSPDRIEPFCEKAGFCGGCDYQMMNYEKQIETKTALALEAFRRIGGMELTELSGVIRSPKEFYYRNTTTFKVNPRRQTIGFFRKDTKFTVDLTECKISMDGINTALSDVREQSEFPKHNFKVRTTLDEDTVVHWVPTEKYEDRAVYETVEAAGQKIKFKISKDSFFQVNDFMIPLWIEKMISFLDEEKSERIFDLYCGIGLITLFVSHFAEETVGVELAKSSVKDADHNIEINNIQRNVRFIQGDVPEVLSKLGKADVMIVDPPRKGIEKEGVDLLLNAAPKKIIYSSCKPSTLARDIKMLSEDYELKELWLVDMFPQTHHMEMLSLLVRK